MKRFLIVPVLLVSMAFLASGNRILFSKSEAENTAIWQTYERYKEPTIKDRMFKHADLLPLIQKHVASKVLKSEVLGNSVQGRSIHHLTLGNGKTKVLLWSQMHGDESTATMALFDIFNFFSVKDEHDAFRKVITDNLELHLVPMLNPDGAEAWKRRGALDIDINRDARSLNTPEGRILTDIAGKLNAKFGFNLHDQSMLLSAGATRNPATISFLAPAYNYAKDMDEVRANATKLIVTMNRNLQKYAPEKIGRYDDSHDPRCFGDTFQGKGMSTILIESGGYPNDYEKQYIRKLNFYTILNALHSIATGSYENENIKDYDAIPENHRSLYDLVVRNAEITKGNIKFRTNLGIIRSQAADSDKRSMLYRGYIDETGDMDKSFGYDEVDASALTTAAGKVKVMTKAEWEKLSVKQEKELIKEGFLYVSFSDESTPRGAVKNRLLNLTANAAQSETPTGLGQVANFILMRNNQPAFAVINGFLVDLEKDAKALPNTFGY